MENNSLNDPLEMLSSDEIQSQYVSSDANTNFNILFSKVNMKRKKRKRKVSVDYEIVSNDRRIEHIGEKASHDIQYDSTQNVGCSYSHNSLNYQNPNDLISKHNSVNGGQIDFSFPSFRLSCRNVIANNINSRRTQSTPFSLGNRKEKHITLSGIELMKGKNKLPKLTATKMYNRSRSSISEEGIVNQFLESVNSISNTIPMKKDVVVEKRSLTTHPKTLQDPSYSIPNDIFCLENSFQPRNEVNLSDWTSLIPHSYEIRDQIKNRLSANCTNLNLSNLTANCRPSHIKDILKTVPNLRCLNLSRCTPISTGFIKLIAKNCSNISTLDLANSDGVTDDILLCIVSTFKQLHVLILSSCSRLTDIGVSRSLVLLERLEVFNFDHCKQITDASLSHILKIKGDYLRVFSCRFCPRISDLSVQALLTAQAKSKTLMELNLNGIIITDSSLEYLTNVPTFYGNRCVQQSYISLRCMDLTGCNLLTNLSCSWIAAAAPFLITLRLCDVYQINDNACISLGSLHLLEEIDLSGCIQITDIGVQHLLQPIPSVTREIRIKPVSVLRIARLREVTGKTISIISNYCLKTLRTLDLSYLQPVTPRLLAKLVKSCSLLTILILVDQKGVDRTVLKQISLCCLDLQELNLRGCAHVDDVALQSLKVCKSLRLLRLSGKNINITEVGLMYLPVHLADLELSNFQDHVLNTRSIAELTSKRLHSLKSLDLSFCNGLTITSINTIFTNCPKLLRLNVFRCQNITTTVLQNVITSHLYHFSMYGIQYFEDPKTHFYGLANPNPHDAESANRRREWINLEKKRKLAISLIQTKFRIYKNRLFNAKQSHSHTIRECYASICIQRMWRGSHIRRRFHYIKIKCISALRKIQSWWRQLVENWKWRKATEFADKTLCIYSMKEWKWKTSQQRYDRLQELKREKKTKARVFWVFHMKKRVLNIWHTYTYHIHVIGVRARAHWRKHIVPQLFHIWKEFTLMQICARQYLVVIFLNTVALETHNAVRQIKNLVLAHINLKRIVWRLWKDFVINQNQFIMQAKTLVAFGSSQLRYTFRAWYIVAKKHKNQKQKHKSIILLFTNRKYLNVWNSWREFVYLSKSIKRAIHMFVSSTKTKSWLIWKQYSQFHKQQQHHIQHMIKFLQIQLLTRWYSHYQDRINMRVKLRQGFALFRNTTILRVLTYWRQETISRVQIKRRLLTKWKYPNVLYTFTIWIRRTHSTIYETPYAIRIQSFWRGIIGRRIAEDFFYTIIYSALVIQTSWRGRLARAIFRSINRTKRLRDYLRIEREIDSMGVEDALTAKYFRELNYVVQIQRIWRGTMARDFYQNTRRAKVLLKKQESILAQEFVRLEANKIKISRENNIRITEMAAVKIQAQIRGYVCRCLYASHALMQRKAKFVVRVQSVYRGRICRRRTAALRRCFATRMEIFSRTSQEGALLRSMGVEKRETQKMVRRLLGSIGLNPSTLVLNFRDLIREVREDFRSFKEFIRLIHVQIESRTGLGKNKMMMARELEILVESTAEEEKHRNLKVSRGDAVRVVLRNHTRSGETAYILNVVNEMAEAKMDLDGAIEFFPLILPANNIEGSRKVLHRIPSLRFTSLEVLSSRSTQAKISPIWREQLEAYAQSIEVESKQQTAARTIQCASRVYLARMRVQNEYEKQGVLHAKRQIALINVLRTFRCATTRTANFLEIFNLANVSSIPLNLTTVPLGIQIVLDRLQRALAKRKEVRHAIQILKRALPSQSLNTSSSYNDQFISNLEDRILYYPYIRLRNNITDSNLAKSLEHSSQHELTKLIGDAALAKTFISTRVKTKEHYFPQLENCQYCKSRGWAVVHGRFEYRKVVVNILKNKNEQCTVKEKRKLVPHGCGVAHFLTGFAPTKNTIKGDGHKKYPRNKSINWLKHNSIEAQFKSLSVVKEQQQREQEDRIATQILTRQATLSSMRSKEGPHGYAKRHSKLTTLEKRLTEFYRRMEDEICLRKSEEQKIFNEEKKLLAVLQTERKSLLELGMNLHALQQQVPNMITAFQFARPRYSSSLELIEVGTIIFVEEDDGEWVKCKILKLDKYSWCGATIEYLDEQIKRTEDIQLVEPLVTAVGPKTDNLSIADIIENVAEEKARSEIPFRRWKAGKAIDVTWTPPFDNGATILAYYVEWEDAKDDSIHGVTMVGNVDGTQQLKSAPTRTTLWPIPDGSESSVQIRLYAENIKGKGVASAFAHLSLAELFDVNYESAAKLEIPPEDTSTKELREMREMSFADKISQELRLFLTCPLCLKHSIAFSTASCVYEHIAKVHNVPLVCSFKGCHQVCASEIALKYHIWHGTVSEATEEEKQSKAFMEFFSVSTHYCIRKPPRHTGSRHLVADEAEITLEVSCKERYQDSITSWLARAKRIHEDELHSIATLDSRKKYMQYDSLPELYGVDFDSIEVNVGRREAVSQSISELKVELINFNAEYIKQREVFETQESETQTYITLKDRRIKATKEDWQRQALQRERKKASKSLDEIIEKKTQLIQKSERHIAKLMSEIERLEKIEQGFFPFIEQLIKVLRMDKMLCETKAEADNILYRHSVLLKHYKQDMEKLMTETNLEVKKLNSWISVMAARERQILDMKAELRRLQIRHRGEMSECRRQRDECIEVEELQKLKQKQMCILTQKERNELSLLKELTHGEAAKLADKKHEHKEVQDIQLPDELITLNIANHDIALHQKFLRGKDLGVNFLDESKQQQLEKNYAFDSPNLFSSQGNASNNHFGEANDVDSSTKQNLGKLSMPIYRRLECQFLNGYIHGFVRIEFQDNSVYEGPWVEDKSYDGTPMSIDPLKTPNAKIHWGKFISNDGTIYEGELVDNFFSPSIATGDGFHIMDPEGNEYTGALHMGKYHGFGTYRINTTIAKGEYLGEWVHGKRHGYGIERFGELEVYEGNWINDKYHGKGEINYNDSSRYSGGFVRGLWHGPGVRTLENGDVITGIFENGYLNGVWDMMFKDGGHYHGDFKNTLREGHGVLTLPNGDRYEGSFHNNMMHGEGLYHSKPVSNGSESVARLGKWAFGQRIMWLNKVSCQTATAGFISHFSTQSTVNGKVGIDLIHDQFTSPYAVMVAKQLPNLPDGVDAKNPFVQTIIHQLAKTQNVVVGVPVLDKTITALSDTKHDLECSLQYLDILKQKVEDAEASYSSQLQRVSNVVKGLNDLSNEETELQLKIENFWKSDKEHLEYRYKESVRQLNQLSIEDWILLRSSSLNDTYMLLLEAFATLLNFSSKANRNGEISKPSKNDIMMLLSDSKENVALGDHEGLIHQYKVKALYILPLFDVYSFGDGARNKMLHSITYIVHHPRLHPGNFRLYQISPALVAICKWVHAAFFYAKKAAQIAPVVDRVMDQLIIREEMKITINKEKESLEKIKIRLNERQVEMQDQQNVVQQQQTLARMLQETIDEIDYLDKAEYTPLIKTQITDSINSTQLNTQLQNQIVIDEENSIADSVESHTHQRTEDILVHILSNKELSQEYELFKLEIAKVLNRCGRTPLVNFAQTYNEVMLKPVNVEQFGVKKLRTLLSMMTDVCIIVPPQNQTELEMLQLVDSSENDLVPMLPRKVYPCPICPGMSFDTKKELKFHEKTKWHYANLQLTSQGESANIYSIKSTCWSEAYDNDDGKLCYYNSMTGQVVKSTDPPLEMEADEIMLEMFDEVSTENDQESNEVAYHMDYPWEQYKDDDGNTYFYNCLTGESCWTISDNQTGYIDSVASGMEGSTSETGLLPKD